MSLLPEIGDRLFRSSLWATKSASRSPIGAQAGPGTETPKLGPFFTALSPTLTLKDRKEARAGVDSIPRVLLAAIKSLGSLGHLVPQREVRLDADPRLLVRVLYYQCLKPQRSSLRRPGRWRGGCRCGK